MAKNQIDFSPTNPENAAAGATAAAETPVVDTTDDDEVQVDVGPVEETPAEVVTLTPEEFAALKSSSDSAKAVKEGIEGLASQLRTPAPVQLPANGPQQTPEEYFAEHSDEIFDKEKGAAVLAKHSKMIAERDYGPLLRGVTAALATTRKELLETKDPYFKRYKAEVEALIAQQPADVQMKPDIVELAWQSVRQRHAADIEAETVKTAVDKAVEEALKARGIDPKAAPGRPAAHVNSAGRSTPQVSSSGSSAPRVRFPDRATETRLRAEANRKGIEWNQFLRTRGYIE